MEKTPKVKNNIKNTYHYLEPNVLNFDSNFESGNLKSAYKVIDRDEYNLLMQDDINTYGYTQWFFFKV
jgi:hypothetical protein